MVTLQIDAVKILSNTVGALTVAGGVVAGHGVHTFGSSGASGLIIEARNTSNANTASSGYYFSNDLSLFRTSILLTSSAFTGYADGFTVNHGGAGPLRLYSSTGVIDLNAGGGVGAMRLLADGRLGIGTVDPASAGAFVRAVAPAALADTVSLFQSASASALTMLGVAAEDYISGPSFVSTFLGQGGSSRAGTTMGLSNVDLGELRFTNTSNAAIWTTNAADITLGTNATARWKVSAAGHLIPVLPALYALGSVANFLTAVTVGGGVTGGLAQTGLSGDVLRWYLANTTTGQSIVAFNGVPAITVGPGITGSQRVAVEFEDGDWGSGPGTSIFIRRNTNGTGAPGFVALEAKDATDRNIWVDTTGVLRIDTAVPFASASDTIGTVVGTQTSTRDTKTEIELRTDYAEMLRAVLDAPLYDWRYRNGAYNRQKFTGFTIDDTPWTGMDPDDDHPHGRSFNPVTTSGYLAGAIKALAARLAVLEAQ